MQESKDGTGRAYLSEPGIRPLSKHKGCYCVPWPSEALDELARILGDTEPKGEQSYLTAHGQINPTTFNGQHYREDGLALAESLAAVTADGGALDQLEQDAWDNMEPCQCPGECRGCFGGLLAMDCPCEERAANYSRELQADPVILAAQRDLAVLSAYAQQRQAGA